MADVCVSRNLTITAGALGIAPWSVFRLVADVTGTSTGDGSLSAQTRLPGKLMIDQQVSWTSDSQLPTRMLLRVTRAYRSIITSNPNAVQLREAIEHAIDATPRVPDPSRLVFSQCGYALDHGTDNAALPWIGRAFLDVDSTSTDVWFTDSLPAGSTLNVHYRTYAWTPPPYSNNANGNSPHHEAHARWTRLQLFAAPTQDEAIR